MQIIQTSLVKQIKTKKNYAKQICTFFLLNGRNKVLYHYFKTGSNKPLHPVKQFWTKFDDTILHVVIYDVQYN